MLCVLFAELREQFTAEQFVNIVRDIGTSIENEDNR